MEFEGAEFWKTIVDKMLAGVFVTDESMKYLYVNDIFSLATGYSKEELANMTILDLAHEDSIEKAKKAVERVLSGETVMEELNYRRKDGRIRTVFGIFRPITYRGKVYGIGNYIDITRTKELERKLKESEEFYRDLIENSEVASYIVQNGKFVFVNKMVEELTGYKREELIGRNAFDLVYPEDRARVFDRYSKREAGLLDAEKYSFRFVTKDGRVCWFTMRAKRIIYKGKPAVYVSGIDNTELMNLTEELKKKNEYFSLISKILRHDILNDLAVIQSAIEIREDSLLEKAYQRINWIVEKIKDIKMLEDAIGELKPVNVAEFVKKVVEKYRQDALFKLKIEDATVMANEALKSVIENLVSNSIIHSQVSPVEITVEVTKAEGECILRVSDNGIGIPDELKERIFEASYSRKGGGLGLFLVKKIVNMFGGNVRIYDNKPRGVVFEVRLPLAQGQSF